MLAHTLLKSYVAMFEDIQRRIFFSTPLSIAVRNLCCFDIVHWLLLNGALAPHADVAGGSIDDATMRQDLRPTDFYTVSMHDNVTLFLTGTIVSPSSSSSSSASPPSSPLKIFQGKAGIVESISYYVGNPIPPQELRILRQLLDLLPIFIEDVPFDSGRVLAKYLESTTLYSRGEFPYLPGVLSELTRLDCLMDNHVAYESLLLAFREDFEYNRSVFGAVLRNWKHQPSDIEESDKIGRILIKLLNRMFHVDNPNRNVQAMVFIESVHDQFNDEINALENIGGEIGTNIIGIVMRLLDCIDPVRPPIFIIQSTRRIRLDQESLFGRTCYFMQILADKVPENDNILLKWNNPQEHGESGDLCFEEKYSECITKWKVARKNYDKACMVSLARRAPEWDLCFEEKYSEIITKWKVARKNYDKACMAALARRAPEPPKPREINMLYSMAMDILRLQRTIIPHLVGTGWDGTGGTKHEAS